LIFSSFESLQTKFEEHWFEASTKESLKNETTQDETYHSQQ